MATTSWLDYIQADATSRLQMDRASAHHREEMAALHAQTQALRDIAVIGVEQVKGLAQVATSVEGVRSDLAALAALFDWRLEQTHQQLQVQSETLNDLV